MSQTLIERRLKDSNDTKTTVKPHFIWIFIKIMNEIVLAYSLIFTDNEISFYRQKVYNLII